MCATLFLGCAAGIYPIYATTGPDTGIITDLIKANIPSRAAFKVSTEDGSKYVLDMEGAQLLQEDGDMLFWLQGYISPLRAQAAQVSDFEIQKVVEYKYASNSVGEKRNSSPRFIPDACQYFWKKHGEANGTMQ